MEDLQTRIRIRFEHAAARRTLEEKYQSKMLFAHSGGMWRAGPELLAVLSSCEQQATAVILDEYKTPVEIDPQELKKMTFQRWQEQMNGWLVEWNDLQKQR